MKKRLSSFRVTALFSVILSLLIFIACRKTSSFNGEINAKQAEEKFYENTTQLNSALAGLVNSFKKEKVLNNNLQEFIKKNGVPVWDKTIYTTGANTSTSQNSKVKTNGIGSHTNSEGTDTSKGLFIVPLKSISNGNIQSYITAYKHDDSNYTYRLYNKDSLDRVHPKDDSAKQSLRSTEAIFGVFEKNINKKDSIITPDGTIRNASLSFGGGQQSTTAKSNKVGVTDAYCLINITMTLYYEWHDLSYSYGNQWELVGASIVIDVYCWSTGDGGNPNQGLDPNNNNDWSKFGTGWPWNNPYLYDIYNPWQYWWTGYDQVLIPGAGGGGGQTSVYDEYTDPAPDSDYDTYDDDPSNYSGPTDPTQITFNVNTDAWPIIPNVIPTSQFVGYHDHLNCLKLAQEQIAKKNLTDLGSADVYQAFKESTGIDVIAARNGVNYIISKLQKGDPVMVAVDNKPGSPPGNPDLTTDHFVVIVGTGHDSLGDYFQFYDSASANTDGGANPYNRLRYDPSTGKITGSSSTGYAHQPGRHPYVVTHIRKNR